MALFFSDYQGNAITSPSDALEQHRRYTCDVPNSQALTCPTVGGEIDGAGRDLVTGSERNDWDLARENGILRATYDGKTGSSRESSDLPDVRRS